MCTRAPTSLSTCTTLYQHFCRSVCHKTHAFQQKEAQENFILVVALYRAAHSVVCYSAHQATTDLLENMPQLLGLKIYPKTTSMTGMDVGSSGQCNWLYVAEWGTKLQCGRSDEFING